MSPRPSVVFLAAIDARAALDRLDDKVRNVRRPLTGTEVYALKLVRDHFDWEPGLGARIDRLIERHETVPR